MIQITLFFVERFSSQSNFPVVVHLYMIDPLFRIRFFARRKWEFLLNVGPLNMKEHVLITIFDNAGVGTVYAIHIINTIKIFYKELGLFVSFLVIMTTQVWFWQFLLNLLWMLIKFPEVCCLQYFFLFWICRCWGLDGQGSIENI